MRKLAKKKKMSVLAAGSRAPFFRSIPSSIRPHPTQKHIGQMPRQKTKELTFQVKEFDELTTRELYEIARARTEIFLMEQRIVCRDLDGEDLRALHCFLEDKNGTVMAYMRAMRSKEDADTVQVGRVLSLTHGVGLGKKLMQLSLPEILSRLPCERLPLHAQTHAVGFYEKWGFAVTSDEFLEEGVPHVTMEKKVAI